MNQSIGNIVSDGSPERPNNAGQMLNVVCAFSSKLRNDINSGRRFKFSFKRTVLVDKL